MNPDPHLYGVSTVQHGCGFVGIENSIRAFWQSRDPEHRLPQLTNFRQLAKDIRRASKSTSAAASIAAANSCALSGNRVIFDEQGAGRE